MKKYIKENPFLCLILLCTAAVLVFLATKNLDIVRLQFINIDDYTFTQVLSKMHEGFMQHNMHDALTYGFYTYGMSYFLAIDVCSFFFLSSFDYAKVLFTARMFSAIPALLSLLYVYRISTIYLTKNQSGLIVLSLLSMSGFWMNAISFHPDFLMLFFWIAALFYFIQDDLQFNELGKY